MDAQKKASMGLKPCIAELVRTQHCPPEMVLLVQMIMAVPVQTPRRLKHAFRMMMTDGEKTIQATLAADMHWFIATREIVVGAFVMLDKYKLAKAMRKNKNGSVAYLQITDLHAIGYVDGYDPSESTQLSKTSLPSKDCTTENANKCLEKIQPIGNDRPVTASASHQVRGDSAVECLYGSAENVGGGAEGTQPPTKKARVDTGLGGDSNQTPSIGRSLTTPNNVDNLDTEHRAPIKIEPKDKEADVPVHNEQNPLPSSLKAFPRNVYRRKIVEHWGRCHRVPFVQLQSPYSSGRATHAIFGKGQPEPHSGDDLTDEQVDALYPQACISLSQYAIYSIEAGKSLKRISRPLDIITLKSLAGLARKQNRICDVLAIIESSPSPMIKRPHLPPKRDVKLSDPTTLKRITLSVFVDAEHFTPAIGTICLVRNVRNHRFDGQSLNAYPEDCDGFDWFIPNPEFTVSEEKVAWLRGWWEERLARKRRWGGCEVDESDPEFGYPAERLPPRERVFDRG